ncbi:hypothetical protein BRD00_00050 [Halobacteriales archaeon QS_8_69_26]|nr:MAG: hypothetical protein BRD00_00050 [Halobacteriales archaeon QS_8_69_26]
MQRRQFLKGVSASAFGVTLASQQAAAECNFEPGVWYDGTVVDVTDGDTFDVVLDCDGQEYEIRHLGLDTPETKRNNRYEEVREWEGIEDDNYLADWGENAKDYAQNEFPDGTPCQIAVDENEDTFDPFDRLLAYVRYDKDGDGSMDTVYNYDVVRKGYARVYSSSLTKHDEYWQAEHDAQSEGLRVWQQSDPENTSEVDNDPVSTVYFPNASSVRTSDGAIADSRVPVYAESTTTQSLDSGGIDYSEIPMVGVDEANNTAVIGGLFINEANEGDDEGEHKVFLSNLIDYLSSKAGKVLIEGGHRQFNADYGLSCEDTVVYQRFLEGVGVAHEGINAVDSDTYENRLSSARAIIVTNSPQSFTTSEKDALANYVSNGGAVILMGSANASATMRSNLHDVAAGIGTDLRLNADQVYDDSNNTGDSSFVTTSNFDTSFPLFDSYTPDSGSSNSSPTTSWVNPSDGETVSGTVTVQIDASDSEDSDDSLDVTYSVDGGSERSTTYNSTSGYYEDSWDTTGVSDGDHTLEATATDSNGASSSSTITVTVDNVESAPTVDSLSLTEVETSDSDAEFDADWSVSDDDGDLDSVDLTLTDDTAGETEDTATVSVSGDTASGTTRLVAAGDDGSGNSYTVEATVTDSDGNSSSDTASTSETEDTQSAPTIDQFDVYDDSNPQWNRYDVDWAVSDGDGDLDTVVTEMLDSSGNVLDSDSDSVSGSSASGSHYVRSKQTASEVVLTVTDAAGNSTSDSQQV